MCLGVPMQVAALDGFTALCVRDDDRRTVDLLITGPQPVGTWLLVHVDRAVRVLDADEAAQIIAALQGLDAALHGDAFEHLFADLINREPQLPPHLRPGADSSASAFEVETHQESAR